MGRLKLFTMRVNELRVGNWIYEEGRHYRQWEPSDFTDYLNRDGEEISDKIEGIPLTPEILERCGFEFPAIIKDVNQLFFLTTDRQGFRLQFEKSHEDVYVCESLPLLHIKYLHQLQNLYFALTGTELEYDPIKETVQRKIDSDFTEIKITDDTIFGRLNTK